MRTVERNAYAAGFVIQVPDSVPPGRVVEGMKFKVRKGDKADPSCYDYALCDWPEDYRWVSEDAAARCYLLLPSCEASTDWHNSGGPLQMVRSVPDPDHRWEDGLKPETISVTAAVRRGIIQEIDPDMLIKTW